MKLKVSLSQLFNEQMAQIEELDTVLSYKRIAQHIKTTAANLEKMEKTGFIMKAMNSRIDVPETKYSVIYKITTNPSRKLIVKKILRRR